MYTKEFLTQQIRNMGISKTDLLSVHISLKAVGNIDNTEKTGAEVMIESLRESVLDGLLIVPAHTFVSLVKDRLFDVKNTPSCVGVMPNVAIQMANHALEKGDKTIVRSMHPSHSVVAFGETAYTYIKEDEEVTTSMDIRGSYGKLATQAGKILLIGVDLRRNTFLHVLDQYMTPDVPSTYLQVETIDYSGNRKERTASYTKGASGTFEKYRECLEKANAICYGKIGDADAILCDAKKCFDVICENWKQWEG